MNDFKNDAVCKSRMISATESPENASEKTEIILIEKGNGLHNVEGRAFPCRENEVYIIKPGVPHSFVAQDRQFPLFLRKIEWQGTVQTADGNILYALLPKDSRDDVARLFDRIDAECTARQYGWQDAVNSCVSLICVCAERYAKNSIRESPASEKNMDSVRAVLHTVETQFGDNSLTLERIAAEYYVSASTLSRRFQKMVGQSFSAFLRHYRMEQACRMLKDSAYPIADIAALCGVRDLTTFYELFRQYSGKTPQKYRKDDTVCDPSDHTEDIYMQISQAVQSGKSSNVTVLISQALAEGMPARELLSHGLITGMNVIGEKFKKSDIYIPEVLLAARAMNRGLEILRPSLSDGKNGFSIGKAVIGTVKGDMHDIGKNIVKIMLEANGIACIDLGVDVSTETWVDAVRQNAPDLVCLSTLLTTTLPSMEDAVKALKNAKFDQPIKIFIGGAPVTEKFAEEIGADVFTDNAAGAAEEAVKLLRKTNGFSSAIQIKTIK